MGIAVQEIPFAAGLASSLDALDGAPPAFINASVRGGTLVQRPGIRAWSGFPATAESTDPVVSMGILGGRLVYVTDDGKGTRKLFMRASSTQVISLSTGTDTQLAGTAPPYITSWRNLAVITGGGAPQRVTTAAETARLGGSPPDAWDACILAQRIVLTSADESGLFYWSGIGETEAELWDTTLDFREAEAQPDPVVACKATSRELLLFGERTLQVMFPDPDETFAPGPVLDVGCLAPGSILDVDGIPTWFATGRRFVLASPHGQLTPDGILSSPALDRTLEKLTTVSDCWGYRETLGGLDSLVWCFPTEGRWFSCDVRARRWSERRAFEKGRFVPWVPRSYLHWPEENVHLVGLSDGTIAELTTEAHTDLGSPIKVVSRTGAIRSPMSRHVERVQMTFRRGEATSDASVEVSWRDDGGKWMRPLRRELGQAGDANPVVTIAPAGAPHYTREYELTFSADEELVFAGATETVTTSGED